jgi:hypothetical protein
LALLRFVRLVLGQWLQQNVLQPQRRKSHGP